MLRKRPTQVSDAGDGAWDDEDGAPGAHRAIRYVVPVAVAGVVAATVGLVPAFAGSGAPALPKISADELIAKIAASDVQQLSGTVTVTTDLGLPSLPDGLAMGGAESAGGEGGEGGEEGEDGDGGSTADPRTRLMDLASGSHTLRIAADGHDKHRVSLMGRAAEYSVIHNGKEVWAYDSGSNTAFHATAPEGAGGKHGKHGKPEKGPADATPQELAKRLLEAADGTTSVTVDGTAKVAGRDAYQLLIEPEQAESTVGSIRIAVDAANGVPLKVTLSPRSGGKAVVDAGFTAVDFAKPDARTFTFTPPKGAKVTEQDGPERLDHAAGQSADAEVPFGPGAERLGLDELSGISHGGRGDGNSKSIGEGWATVVRLKAPDGSRAPSGEDGMSPGGRQFIDSLGEKVTGTFGSGTVFSTRLINALVTDDGTVYAGAVTKAALVKAAEAAE